MNKQSMYLLLLILVLLLPLPVWASHSTDALAALPYLIGGLLLAILFIVFNFVLALKNIRRKSAGMRLASMLMSVPVLAAGLWIMSEAPSFGFILLTWVLIQGLLIYGSFTTTHEKDV